MVREVIGSASFRAESFGIALVDFGIDYLGQGRR
jgi:hypothetical protein